MANNLTPTHPTEARKLHDQRLQEEADRFKMYDDEAYDSATGGWRKDPELVEKVLAAGGDITRSSPTKAQQLPDAVPGLTTTTGAHRTPIDPTTAAVPAPPRAEIVEKMRGAATIGSGRAHDTPEKFGFEPPNPVGKLR